MNLEKQYALALWRTQDSKKPSNELLENLKTTLSSRGHLKLLPKIYSEYERLLLQAKRHDAHTTYSAEEEQKRILLELYRKLITTH